VSLGTFSSKSQSGHLGLLSLFWKFEFVGLIIMFFTFFWDGSFRDENAF
jgi:hypothetical protein